MRNGLIAYKKKMINNKKAQLTLNYAIVAILGVLLVVAIGIFIFQTTSKASEPIEVLPDKLSQKALACQNPLNQANFCQFADVGENAYSNCEHDDSDFQASIGDSAERYSCASDKAFGECTRLEKNAVDAGEGFNRDTLVNNKPCSYWFGPGAGAE